MHPASHAELASVLEGTPESLAERRRGLTVAFLAARRRHPAARVLMLLFALLVMGALSTLLAPGLQSSADTGTSQQVAQGKALFAVQCASCHGLNGEGQTTPIIQGPPLAGVGAAAVSFQVGTGRMPLSLGNVAQAPVHAVRFSDEEIAAMA